jgi:hypothetical protein
MLKYNIKAISYCMLSALLISVVSLSCEKNNSKDDLVIVKGDTTLVIVTIIDSLGSLVDSATVRLYYDSANSNEPDIRFDSVRITNAAGQARWDLSDLTKPGQAGFAVLDITAFKEDLLGVGIVNVEEQKTTNQTVRIQ